MTPDPPPVRRPIARVSATPNQATTVTMALATPYTTKGAGRPNRSAR